MTFINLTCAASVLGQAAAQFGAIFPLETCAFVEAVAFTASCSQTKPETQKFTSCQPHFVHANFFRPFLFNLGCIVGTLTVLALVTQEVSGAAAGWLVSSADCAVASIFAVILTGMQVTVWTSKARQASTCRRACENKIIIINFKL